MIIILLFAIFFIGCRFYFKVLVLDDNKLKINKLARWSALLALKRIGRASHSIISRFVCLYGSWEIKAFICTFGDISITWAV